MISPDAKIKIQNFGRFLSNMVMPNIGAFIAWGFITALFIPTGWLPNETLASMVGPMITYLLPLLIGYTGGKLVGGDRGAVVGAITTMGVIVGTDIPMFMGAMMVGPMGGWAIKKFDNYIDGKVKSGFEMLVNNFSAGIIGMLCAILAFFLIGPFVKVLSGALAAGVNFLVSAHLLPLTSIFVEPAKILFLNNAINHGIFSPLGIQQASETGQSIFFLIEANPGPGLGILLAYMVFGKGTARQTAGGASIIHFFGGIHEIYFPYILMNPRLILAAIAGGMTGVFVLTMFNAGIVSPASPGSIFAILLMTQKGSIVGVLASIAAATGVSFAVASLLMKTQTSTEEDGDEAALEKATSQMKDMKSASKNGAVVNNESKGDVDLATVQSIIVACDAGMGSSAMGASMLRKKVQDAGLNVHVTNLAINSLPESADIVITHKDLTDRARKHAPNAHHISLTNFLDSEMYNQLVTKLLAAQKQSAANDDKMVKVSVLAANDDSFEPQQPSVFQIQRENIHLGLKAANKEEAIRFAGNKLVELGYAEPEYVDAMFEREALVPTYLGESIAVPHGTVEAKDRVKKTGIVICQYPSGIQFTEDDDDVAKLVIGIAAKNDEHIQVITTITNALDEPEAIKKLTSTNDVEEILNILGGQQAA
ncbi:TPA: PTS mannitol transporter subunit IICBA [Vibrio parahaemolyticus]|uniref:PTS mannitol transporter subunit IICBA n=1 Tax=Vibrio parahaemolyticus TaxID=670 RepID=UPI0011229B61|nr:PTS mannitol transporter subunit IICBA [Vibrio parahaemolyticus]EHR0552907.1 PTS mannitol transporter subunit IICBA [Vibrio parahaemolyticus]EIO5096789.1 PTS mannitol transporter subunit IICBA [Vibrio parahaemolyticus]MBE3869034.1 PTS mannitol transporter subunit IICBA [Vibrio parahaemolyticus]MDF4486473.1 PTS mannitol transporter subunit IICBA [Vibrio parahaemolyticus]MDG3381034.1 PTS mannitol transporter subunit IICBA [Vibrio parahaemolyticus]